MHTHTHTHTQTQTQTQTQTHTQTHTQTQTQTQTQTRTNTHFLSPPVSCSHAYEHVFARAHTAHTLRLAIWQELVDVEFNGCEFVITTPSGYSKVSDITEVEDVSYVTSPYIPPSLRVPQVSAYAHTHTYTLSHICIDTYIVVVVVVVVVVVYIYGHI